MDISEKRLVNKDFSVTDLSRDELKNLVFALADILGEHIDAILLTAADDEFLSSERISGVCQNAKSGSSDRRSLRANV